MPNIGPLEILVVLIIALIVFGPKRLPELGRSLGKGIREFRGSIGGDDGDDNGEGEKGERATPAQIESSDSEPADRGKSETVGQKRG